ncbi:class I SAM-dependent methyltransferase [Patescibacteria group bacterium]|nr:class I SAM-dependent methyltransferase [Patescibacteria group bacterium]
MEKRKHEEKTFHNKVRDKKLEKNASQHKHLTSNKKIYSITRKSRNFVNNWLIKNCSNKKTLDYCCGDGDMAIFLAKNNAYSFGIDISDVSIQNCKKSAANNNIKKKPIFLIMDAEKLEFPDNYFDIITCIGMLHHLDINKAYIELKRVIKPNGKIICNEPLVYNPIFHLYRKLTPHLRTKWEMNHILNKKAIMDAKKYFNKIDDIKFFHLFTVLAVPFRNLKIFNFVLTFFEKIDSIILRIPIIKWLAWQTVFILSNPKK